MKNRGRTKCGNVQGLLRNQCRIGILGVLALLGVNPHLCVADVRPCVYSAFPRVSPSPRLVPIALAAPLLVVGAPAPDLYQKAVIDVAMQLAGETIMKERATNARLGDRGRGEGVL